MSWWVLIFLAKISLVCLWACLSGAVNSWGQVGSTGDGWPSVCLSVCLSCLTSRDQKCGTPVFYPQVSDSVVPTSIFQKRPPETPDANCAETFSVCMEFCKYDGVTSKKVILIWI